MEALLAPDNALNMLSASARALFFFTATCVVNAWTTLQPSAYHRRRGVRVRAGDDDLISSEDGGGGINWLPPIKSTPDEEKSTPESQVLPLFPLGEVVYLPNTGAQPLSRQAAFDCPVRLVLARC